MGCLKLSTYKSVEPDYLRSKTCLTSIKSEKTAYRDYLYGFNSMERDNELNGGGNSYDFTGNGYDPRGAHRKNLDPFADKNPTFSPYSYAGDNPILFIDANGQFKISKSLQKKYPQLTNVLKSISQKIHNDPDVYAAFKNTLGLTDKQANKILEFGKGPRIKIEELSTAPEEFEFAYTNTNPFFGFGKIAINKELINALEGKGVTSQAKTFEGTVFLIYVTLLHEGQHSGENIKKGFLQLFENYDPADFKTEKGWVFEIAAFGKIVLDPDKKVQELKNKETINNFFNAVDEFINNGEMGTPGGIGETKGTHNSDFEQTLQTIYLNSKSAPFSKDIGIKKRTNASISNGNNGTAGNSSSGKSGTGTGQSNE